MARELVDESAYLIVGNAAVEKRGLTNPTVYFSVDGHLHPYTIDGIAWHKSHIDHYHIVVGFKEMLFGIEDAGDVAEQCGIKAQRVGNDEVTVCPIVMLLAESFGVNAVSLYVADKLRFVVLTGGEAEESNNDDNKSV